MRALLQFVVLLTCILSINLPTLAAYDSAQQANSGDLTLLRMTPEGDNAETTKEFVFTFDRDVVPVGRMERTAEEIPITITPTVKCQWRWLSRNTLACRLDEKDQLQPSTQYEVVINPGIVTEDGVGMVEAITKKVVTQLPQVKYVNFREWKASDNPVIRVTFNQPVSKSSVAKALELDPQVNFDVFADDEYKEEPLFLMLSGDKTIYINVNSDTKTKSDDQAQQKNGEEFRRNWLIQPTKGFGLDKEVQIKIKPGLVSAYGPLVGAEDRVAMTFNTFPDFHFLGVRCYPSKASEANIKNLKPIDYDSKKQPIYSRADGSVLLTSSVPLNEQPKCNPIRGVGLTFSTPVSSEQIKKYLKLLPDLAGNRTDYDPWANMPQYSQVSEPHSPDQTYTVWLPEFLKAFESYKLNIGPQEEYTNWWIRLWNVIKSIFSNEKIDNLEDAFGTTLDAPIHFEFMTDHREPDFHLDYDNAVLESGLQTEQPLFVTNLSFVDFNYSRITTSKNEVGLTHRLEIPKVQDVSFKIPMQIREMLGTSSGVIVGQFETNPSIKRSSYYCDTCFLTQVTPWNVHAKIGHYNSMVWVTDFATGKPVSDAKVELFLSTREALTGEQKIETQGITKKDGTAELAGTMEFDPQLDRQVRYHDWYLKVTRDKEIALLPLTYTYKVNASYSSESYNDDEEGYAYEYASQRRRYFHIHTWGTTAQGIYRIGDTVQYKIYVRDQDNKKFVAAPNAEYSLKVTDPQGNAIHEQEKIVLNDVGAFSGEFQLDKRAQVGWYQFALTPSYVEDLTWTPMRVLVSDFTPASFRVTNELNGEAFLVGDELQIASHARLYGGGPYVDAKVKVSTLLKPTSIFVKEDQLKDFSFDSNTGNRDSITLNEIEGMLDKQGDYANSLAIPAADVVNGKLIVETRVRDDRGKDIASVATARYAGRDRYIGLKLPSWLLDSGKSTAVEWAVINDKGLFVSDSSVEISIQYQETKASRVKGAGNAYITEYKQEWITTKECKTQSTLQIEKCEFVPEKPGDYRIVAKTVDTHKREHKTELSVWASGKDYVLWAEPDNNTLQVIAQQDTYKVGDTAKFLVKNPYPGAMAMITVERYGVMRHYLQKWDSSTPIVEIPIELDDVPGFYLSMMVSSPRVDKPLDENEVDLGKPAYKIAYRKIEVIDPAKQLEISIKSDHELYKPKETATIELTVTDQQKRTLKGKQEIAVTVLDESVFDLLKDGDKNFDIYRGFYRLDGRDLENYNLLTRLIGRQKFEKKGANQGGDGGASVDMRTISSYVSYWNPSLMLDENGRATFTVKLPDNLTSWRVLAMATTPEDKMGLGVHTFKVNKDIEIRPVMPNQVTEGDQFTAGFTVMNRTDTERDITVNVSADGAINTHQETTTTVKAKPFERNKIWLPVITKGDGKIEFNAVATSGDASDGLQYAVPVNKYRSFLTAANYGTTTQKELTEKLAIPKDIYGDVGEISFVLSPSVIGNIDGAFKYVRDYPYWCWEQRLTKAIMASHFKELKAHLADDLTWPNSEELAQEVLDDAASFQAPNGGMSYWLPEDSRANPYLSVYTALAFNWLRDAGYIVPSNVESKLHEYLHTMLRDKVFPTFYSEGMSSSVRAVALAALAQNGKIAESDLMRYKPALAQMDLFGKAHFLQAALSLKSNALAEEVGQNILAQSTQSGGKFQFNERWDDSYAQILATPLRSNCAILNALVTMGEIPELAKPVADIPFKLVRSITQSRGNRDHFENTQENVFCMNALVTYSKVYEATNPDMTLKVSLDQEPLGENHFKALTDKPVTYTKAMTQDVVGQAKTISLEKSGDGRVYFSSRLRYAPLANNSTDINAGIELHREYSVERDKKWILLKSPIEIKRGELVRVDLYLTLPSTRNFVVINDPVAGGLEPVNRDLATTSMVDVEKGKFQAEGGSWWFKFSDWSEFDPNSTWNFYHKELKNDVVRFYSDYLPAGNYHLSYVAQAIADGTFRIQPAHAEEMYDPDIFGKTTPIEMKVLAE